MAAALATSINPLNGNDMSTTTNEKLNTNALMIVQPLVPINEPDDMPTQHDIDDIIKDAFELAAKGEKMLFNAKQHLAYAIMCEYQLLIRDNDKLPALNVCYASSKATNELNDAMITVILNKRPSPKKTGTPDELAAPGQWDDRKAIYNEAFAFVVWVASFGVNHTHYSTKTRTFNVPFMAMFRKEWKVEPKASQKDMWVPLVNRNFAGNGETTDGQHKDKVYTVRSSFGAVLAAAKITKPRAAGAGTGASAKDAAGNIKLKDAKVDDLAKALPRFKLLEAFHRRFMAETTVETPWNKLHQAERNMLTNIMLRIDNMKHATPAKTDKAKPAA